MASWLLGMNGGGAGGAGGSITQTTDTLAVIEALTPGLGDQGFPTDETGQELVALVAGTWTTYYLETLQDIDFTAEANHDFGAGGDGTKVVNGRTWLINGSAGANTTFEIQNGTGLVAAGDNGTVVYMYLDPNQWATSLDGGYYRLLMDIGASSLGANAQVFLTGCGNLYGSAAGKLEVLGGTVNQSGVKHQMYLAKGASNNTTSVVAATAQWYELRVGLGGAALFYGSSVTLPDMDDLTIATGFRAPFAVSSGTANVWEGADFPYLGLRFYFPATSSVTIERLVIQSFRGATT